MSWDDKRPMSPHLQVYKLPLIARLSLLHRLTGGVLFMSLLMMILGLAIASQGIASWQFIQLFLSSDGGHFLLLIINFSLYYHLCHGIRHLFWDIGKGFALPIARQSGIVVIIVSSLLTLITWFMAWFTL